MKGDIAEIEVQLKALKLGWDVLIPVGDRLPYDLVVVVNNVFIKIQVKSAWFSEKDKTVEGSGFEAAQNAMLSTRKIGANHEGKRTYLFIKR